MPTKLYCYVDESWLFDANQLYIVSVVATDQDKASVRDLCENFERESGKGRLKWAKAKYEAKITYINKVIERVDVFGGRLFYAEHSTKEDTHQATVDTIAKAIIHSGNSEGDNIIIIDALPKSRVNQTGVDLRKAGVRTKKVRGLPKEESDALSRLADAVSGLARGACDGNRDMYELLNRAIQVGILRKLPPCKFY